MKFLFFLITSLSFAINIFAQASTPVSSSSLLFDNFKDIKHFDERAYQDFILYAEKQLSGCYESIEDNKEYTVVVCQDKSDYKIEIISNVKALKKELRFSNQGLKEMENYYFYNIPILKATTYDKKGKAKTIVDNEANMAYKVTDLIEKFNAFDKNTVPSTNLLDKSIYNVVLINPKTNTIHINLKQERKTYATFNFKTGELVKI